MQTDILKKLPNPDAPIPEVCEICFNTDCNDEIEIEQNKWIEGELIGDWVKRCHAVSAKYGFEDDVHKYCPECGQPRIHEPLCIECHDADENAEADGSPMRFEHAIDVLIKAQEAHRQSDDTEAEIADIEDAINNLYVIREVCQRITTRQGRGDASLIQDGLHNRTDRDGKSKNEKAGNGN